MRRMRIREEGAIVEHSYQEHRHSYSGPPSTDNGYYRAPHSTPEGVAHYPRAQSSENFRSPYVRKNILIINQKYAGVSLTLFNIVNIFPRFFAFLAHF